jgi:hypothetical protein
MTKQELETWLCGAGAPVPTPAEIAGVLGVPHESIADTALLRVSSRLTRVRFTIAVLRDVFADDEGVRWWLRAPRAELHGRTGLELLMAGQTPAVEELAVREWHRPAVSAAGACVRVLALARTA